MLQCAKEVPDRPPGRRLNFSDFPSSFSKELKRPSDRSHQRQLNRIQDKNGQEKKKKSRKMPKSLTHDVFLGGSCNPTTWRHEVAIPLFESFGISYYNPQVSEWSADLVAIEHRAKACAKVLFYVLDKQTRNVVTIVEVANLIASSRTLVLVFDMYQPDDRVAGEIISNTELEELKGSLATLQDLVGRHGTPTFKNIRHAINHTAKYMRQEDCKGRGSLKYNPYGPYELRQIFEALDENESGLISLADLCTAYTSRTNRKFSRTDLKEIVGEDPNPGVQVNFEQFCTMVSKIKHNGTPERLGNCFSTTPSNPSDCLFPIDIFIEGSCLDKAWRSQIAEPILVNSRLRFKFGESAKIIRTSRRDLEAIEKSFLILFLIMNSARGLEDMVLASYFMSLGRNVVLCVQDLPEGISIGNEKLSHAAINDYNRGRYYLKDEARRKGVRVFQSSDDAVQYAIDECRRGRNILDNKS